MMKLVLIGMVTLAAAGWGFGAEGPRVSPEEPGSLQAGIDAAVKRGAKKLVVPKGTYRLAETLRIADAKNLHIEAAGVTLLRADLAQVGVTLDRCEGTTLSGLTMRCEQVPFTQGTIEAIGEGGKTIELRVDDGYPTDYLIGRTTTGYCFDPRTRQWKPDTYDYGIESGEKLGGRRLRLTLGGPLGPDSNVKVGDLMAFRGGFRQDVTVNGCKGVRLVGLTLFGGSGFCVHESGGEGNYYNYTLTYPPKPPGASAAPLIASNADAFHSGGARVGPTLEGCKFEGMCDDGIPIHGYYGMVVEGAGKELVIGCPWNNNFFRPGDTLRLLDKSGAVVAEAKVLSSVPAEGYTPESLPKDDHFEFSGKFYRLALDKPVKAEPGFRVGTPNANGSGFVIRGCTIKNHRARGILIKADDGLIEGNEVDGSTIAGLVISPEYYWNEAGYGRNITVRNNVFRHCGYATAGPWTGQAGAVTVAGEGDQTSGIAFGNQHLRFVNNAFEDNDGVNLLIDGAQDVLISGNTFLRPQRQASRRGADRGIDPAALIFLQNCRDVKVQGNMLVSPGSALETPVKLGPHAADVTGAGNGVKPQKD